MTCNKNHYLYKPNRLQLENSISNIYKNEYKYFLNKKNVVSISCGYKAKNGFKTFNLCIQVFVKKKISKFLLCKNELIPSYYKNIPTDVIETGEIFSCSLKNRVRPVLGGYCISLSNEASYGSVGCLVSNGVSDFLLSTSHMLTGEGEFEIGTPIVQPAHFFSGIHPRDTIGTLNKYIPLRPIEGESEPINLIDCALGLLTNPNILSSHIALIGKLKGVKKVVKLNDEVKKVGATSELTTGIVTGIHCTTIVRFKIGRRYLFQDLIITSSLSQPGDSGAILINKNNYGIGMTFAINTTISVNCYLNTVLDQLDVKLVI